MTLRNLRRRMQKERVYALQRFKKHYRKNRLSKAGPHRFIIVLDHLKPAFNIGKIFRSADAFGAKEVHLVGIDFFDPAPAMGSFKWVPAIFHQNFEECREEIKKRGYSIFIMEPSSTDSLLNAKIPKKSAFVFGNEELGFSFDPKDYPDIHSIKIPQFGKVQSLNVSVAASVVMYEYVRQHCNAK